MSVEIGNKSNIGENITKYYKKLSLILKIPEGAADPLPPYSVLPPLQSIDPWP